MKVYVGSDHNGYEPKKQVIKWLKNHDIEEFDLGAADLVPGDDYNDYAVMVANEVLANPDSFGILLCGSAQGMCMQANRFKGIRAAFCRNAGEAAVAREHNNANILCLPADESFYDYQETIDAFLRTSFLNLERYIRRNQKLDEAISCPN